MHGASHRDAVVFLNDDELTEGLDYVLLSRVASRDGLLLTGPPVTWQRLIGKKAGQQARIRAAAMAVPAARVSRAAKRLSL